MNRFYLLNSTKTVNLFRIHHLLALLLILVTNNVTAQSATVTFGQPIMYLRSGGSIVANATGTNPLSLYQSVQHAPDLTNHQTVEGQSEFSQTSPTSAMLKIDLSSSFRDLGNLGDPVAAFDNHVESVVSVSFSIDQPMVMTIDLDRKNSAGVGVNQIADYPIACAATADSAVSLEGPTYWVSPAAGVGVSMYDPTLNDSGYYGESANFDSTDTYSVNLPAGQYDIFLIANARSTKDFISTNSWTDGGGYVESTLNITFN